MALETVQKPERYGGYRITIPKQKAYVTTHEFMGDKFIFHKHNGCVVGKGLKPTFDAMGKQITNYGIDEVLKHFEGKGFKITDLDKKKTAPLPKTTVKPEVK